MKKKYVYSVFSLVYGNHSIYSSLSKAIKALHNDYVFNESISTKDIELRYKQSRFNSIDLELLEYSGETVTLEKTRVL